MKYIYFNADKSIKSYKLQNIIATSNNADIIYIFSEFDISKCQCYIRFKRADGFVIGDLKCNPVQSIESPIKPGIKIRGFSKHLTSDILGVSGPLQITVTFKHTVGSIEYSIAQGLVVANVLEAVDPSYEQNQALIEMMEALGELETRVEDLESGVVTPPGEDEDNSGITPPGGGSTDNGDNTETPTTPTIEKIKVTAYKKVASENDASIYEVEKGTTLAELSLNSLVKEGYTFSCWCLDSTLLQTLSNTYSFTTNTSIYAKWTRSFSSVDSMPTVLFNSELYDSRYLECEIIEVFDSLVNVQMKLKDGVYFRYVDINLLDFTPIVGDTIYFDIQSRKDDSLSKFKDSTINVSPIMLTVTYYQLFDGVVGEKIGEESVEKNSKIVYPEISFIEGYTFNGWYRKVDGKYTKYLNSGVAENITLYAYYVANEIAVHSLKFIANGSEVDTASITDGMAIRVSDLPKNPEYEGNVGTDESVYFAGWYEVNSGTRIQANSIITSSMTLYARWKKLAPGKVEQTVCSNCHGFGYDENTPCTVCGGLATDYCEHCNKNLFEPCEPCDGTGSVYAETMETFYKYDNESNWS